MFIENQSKEQRDYYERLLKAVGSLSKLFSESSEPYIAYRAAENLFCKAFETSSNETPIISFSSGEIRFDLTVLINNWLMVKLSFYE